MSNKEPFNYNKCMERGGYAITRDGRRVRLLCDDAEGNYPIVGHIKSKGPKSWTDDGRYFGTLKSPLALLDLFTPPPEPKRIQGWLNVYCDGCIAALCATKEEADRIVGDGRFACLYIDTYEGEGLEITDADYPEPDGKPSWDDAPEWASWLAQDEDGVWYWYEEKPRASSAIGKWQLTAIRQKLKGASDGEPNPNWKQTLEPSYA